MQWLLAVILLVSFIVPAAYAAPKPSKIPKPTKEVRSFGKRISKTIDRQGGEQETYPGVLVHERKGGKVTAHAWLADCDEEMLCLLNSGHGCYLDEHWLFVSPRTFGTQVLEKICKDLDDDDAPEDN